MSLRVPLGIYTDERSEFTDGMGWDGMGWDGMGWDGTENQKCPSIFLYFVGIEITYKYTYICRQKFSAQISCGFKILVKLGG